MHRSEWGARYAVLPLILQKIADSTTLPSDSPPSLTFIVLLWITLHLSVPRWPTQGTSSQHGHQTTHQSLLEEEEVSALLKWRAQVSKESVSGLRWDWWSPSDINNLRVPSWHSPCHFHRGTQPILISLCLQYTPEVRTFCVLTKWGTEEETERNTLNKEATHKWVFLKPFSKACVKVWNIYTAILETYRVSNSKIGILRIPGREETAKYIDTDWISSVGLWGGRPLILNHQWKKAKNNLCFGNPACLSFMVGEKTISQVNQT